MTSTGNTFWHENGGGGWVRWMIYHKNRRKCMVKVKIMGKM